MFATKKQSKAKVIDFHSHILPGADHGSESLETSLRQLRLMEKAGVDIAVATAHFYPHEEGISEFLKRRDGAADVLSAANETSVRIALGAEVYCIAGLENYEGLENLTVKGTNVLLLEMPMSYWNTNIIDTVFALSDRFDVVLAHIDRYPSSDLDKLLYMGIKCQINAGNSLRRHNKERVERWLSEGMIYALGSDLHEASAAAVKDFGKLRKYLKADAEFIFERTEKLLENAELM